MSLSPYSSHFVSEFMSGWFVTGTDTGVGKTLVSQALLTALVRRGCRAAGMKPVASGCVVTPAGLRCADAEALIAAGNVAVEYVDVNPYAFQPSTAPHLAAADTQTAIELEVIRNHYRNLAARADDVIVEGVGGWLVPIGTHATMADVVRRLELPVILVVGVRLGAINHALLTRAAIEASGCRLAGWVANMVVPQAPPGYVETLCTMLPAPFIGEIPCGATVQAAAARLNLDALAPAGA